jgi:hypothetical protein
VRALGRWNRRTVVIAATACAAAIALAVCLVLVFTGGSSPAKPEQPRQFEVLSPFTGQPIPAAGPVLAVKLDNITQARPQTGLSGADIVYVLPAEGGLSRILAVFSSHLPPVIGPVGHRPGAQRLGGGPGAVRSVGPACVRLFRRGVPSAALRGKGPDRRLVLRPGRRLLPRPYAESTGSGTAVVLRDGRAHDARCPGPAPNGGTTFTTASGQPMTFSRGPVWIVLAADKQTATSGTFGTRYTGNAAASDAGGCGSSFADPRQRRRGLTAAGGGPVGYLRHDAGDDRGRDLADGPGLRSAVSARERHRSASCGDFGVAVQAPA